MNDIKVIDSEMDEMVNCPLLKKDIDKGYCYEVGLVIGKIVKPSILLDNIGDREAAKEICNNCKHCQQ